MARRHGATTSKGISYSEEMPGGTRARPARSYPATWRGPDRGIGPDPLLPAVRRFSTDAFARVEGSHSGLATTQRRNSRRFTTSRYLASSCFLRYFRNLERLPTNISSPRRDA